MIQENTGRREVDWAMFEWIVREKVIGKVCFDGESERLHSRNTTHVVDWSIVCLPNPRIHLRDKRRRRSFDVSVRHWQRHLILSPIDLSLPLLHVILDGPLLNYFHSVPRHHLERSTTKDHDENWSTRSKRKAMIIVDDTESRCYLIFSFVSHADARCPGSVTIVTEEAKFVRGVLLFGMRIGHWTRRDEIVFSIDWRRRKCERLNKKSEGLQRRQEN